MAQRDHQRFLAINTTRRARLFNVFEHEMDTLSTWNTISTAMVGVGSFALSAAFTLWAGNEINPAATDDGRALVAVGVPLALIVCVAAYLLAAVFILKRGGTLKRIKTESADNDGQ
jgi:hypothetical protein